MQSKRVSYYLLTELYLQLGRLETGQEEKTDNTGNNPRGGAELVVSIFELAEQRLFFYIQPLSAIRLKISWHLCLSHIK